MHRLFHLALTATVCAMLPACKDKQTGGDATDKEYVEKRPSAEISHSGKVMLMHYMPWYVTPDVRGYWGSHWTGPKKQHDPSKKNASGLPDIWSHYHPLIGTYDSTDAAVLECQLLQMKMAGVDGVIVDWYGIGKAADYSSNHDATKAMFEAASRLGMKFAACYEDRSLEYMVKINKLAPDAVESHLTETVEWMDTHWFSKPHYYDYQDRPLLLNFGPIYLKDKGVWDRALAKAETKPNFFALHHLWKKVGADGGFSWVHKSAWKGSTEFEVISRKLQGVYQYTSSNPEQLIVSAYPGFKDVYENSHPVLEHRDGKTMDESLKVALGGPWPVVQLVTWNDYGEGTMIEPTHEFGYQFLEIIQRQRKEELGDALPFKPSDLRLPARLLKLRKAAKTNPKITSKELDLIAILLAEGSCKTAEEKIQTLEAQ